MTSPAQGQGSTVVVGAVLRDSASTAFFSGTACGHLPLSRCGQGHWSRLDSESCETCGDPDLREEPASGRARVVSWTIVHRRGQPLSVVVLAELAEGPWWWSHLVGDHDAIIEGADLTIEFQRADPDSESVPVFCLDRLL